MGTSGVPWDVSKDAIIECLRRKKGRLVPSAKDLNCAYSTLKKRIDADQELTDLVKYLRNEFDDILVTTAEDTLLMAAGSRKEDMANALKASFYILNNKGKSLGYGQRFEIAHANALLEEIHDEAETRRDSEREAERPVVEDQQPLLD